MRDDFDPRTTGRKVIVRPPKPAARTGGPASAYQRSAQTRAAPCSAASTVPAGPLASRPSAVVVCMGANAAAGAGAASVVEDAAGAWREILCVQDDRWVGNDSAVQWRRLSLQTPPSRLRPHFVKAMVRVHEYPDGRLTVYWGPHRLADYDARGTIVQTEKQTA